MVKVDQSCSYRGSESLTVPHSFCMGLKLGTGFRVSDIGRLLFLWGTDVHLVGQQTLGQLRVPHTTLGLGVEWRGSSHHPCLLGAREP